MHPDQRDVPAAPLVPKDIRRRLSRGTARGLPGGEKSPVVIREGYSVPAVVLAEVSAIMGSPQVQV